MKIVNTLRAEPVWVVQLFKTVVGAIFCTGEFFFECLDAILRHLTGCSVNALEYTPQAPKALEQSNYYSIHSQLFHSTTLPYHYIPTFGCPSKKQIPCKTLSAPNYIKEAIHFTHFQLNSQVHFQQLGILLLCLSHHEVLGKATKKLKQPKKQTKNPTPNNPHTHKYSKCLFLLTDALSVLLLPSAFQKGKQPFMSTLLDLLSPKQSSLS